MIIERKVLFSGNMTHRLDPKSRVSMPAAWRSKSSNTLKLIEAQREGYQIIKCYTEDSFQSMVSEVRCKAEAAGHAHIEIEKYLGAIIGVSYDTELSSQGKLLIPKKQRDKMKLLEQLTIVGRGDYFELWHPSAYDAVHLPDEIQKLALNKMFGILS